MMRWCKVDNSRVCLEWNGMVTPQSRGLALAATVVVLSSCLPELGRLGRLCLSSGPDRVDVVPRGLLRRGEAIASGR